MQNEVEGPAVFVGAGCRASQSSLAVFFIACGNLRLGFAIGKAKVARGKEGGDSH
jgi:hypothetical protein